MSNVASREQTAVEAVRSSSSPAPSPASQILLKAFPLKNSGEVTQIKEDVKNKTIVILKITPLAQKSIEDLKSTIEDLTDFTISFGGDIARLGEERIVITPPGVKIWRGEKSSSSSAGSSSVEL